MRALILAAFALLAACATIPVSDYPEIRYADAASRGALATMLVARPNQRQVDQATNKWSEALSDSFACDLDTRNVIEAGLVGALEIGAMNAAASGGGEREIRDGVARYVAQLAVLALADDSQPSRQRCDALASWAPRTAADGRDAVARARHNGLMQDDYGLLLDLLAR